MARVKKSSFQDRLKQVLIEGLAIAGIKDAEVLTEPIRGTKLTRVTVVSRKLRHLKPSERQDLLWRIVSQHFKPEEELQISTIYTFVPEDLQAA